MLKNYTLGRKKGQAGADRKSCGMMRKNTVVTFFMWRRNPMHYTSQYPSPLGELLLAADDDGLTGVWFVGQKYFARSLAPDSVARRFRCLHR